MGPQAELAPNGHPDDAIDRSCDLVPVFLTGLLGLNDSEPTRDPLPPER